MEYVYLSKTYWYRSALFAPKCPHACAHFTNEYVTINLIIRRATLNLTIKTRKCVCVCVLHAHSTRERHTHSRRQSVCKRGACMCIHIQCWVQLKPLSQPPSVKTLSWANSTYSLTHSLECLSALEIRSVSNYSPAEEEWLTWKLDILEVLCKNSPLAESGLS